MISMQDNKPIDPSTGEPIPNPKPDPSLPDDWPPKPPRDRGEVPTLVLHIPTQLPALSTLFYETLFLFSVAKL
jgi:hypothetical protein